MTSSRSRTQTTGWFVRDTASSQTLQRGLLLLRAFRAGTSALTNSHLAEKVGLPRPTVSRMTHALVESGFLNYDVAERAYRLAPVVLSLADAFAQANKAPEYALPLMRRVANAERVNVGLAVSDRTDMVYLAAVRQGRDSVSRLRRVVRGTRVPMGMSSIGLAYLAGLHAAAREAVLQKIEEEVGDRRSSVRKRILQGISQAQELGYCTAAILPGHLLAVGASFVGADNQLYAINISYPCRQGHETRDNERYAKILLRLIPDIKREWLSANKREGIATIHDD